MVKKYTDANKNRMSEIFRRRDGNNQFLFGQCFRVTFKCFVTILLTLTFAGTIVLGYIVAYALKLSDDKIVYDMRATKLHLTSLIYVNDENNSPVEYDRVYNLENRIWVDFNDIPQGMKDAIIAIEDKRFEKHRGVDVVRTFGAITSLLSGTGSYGGSTLTQQLIKNLTDDNDASILRKVREIFRALNFEKEYSKDEILEAYLNVVNFGGGCRGVQAAANAYFKKDIKDCSLAECAAIAGITQNPAAYNPLVYPENNKKRRETVLDAMLEQKKISNEEYNKAMKESSDMLFVDDEDDEETETSYNPVRNWYMEAMFEDIINDLSSNLGISKDSAQEMLYTQGLQIYSAMDMKAQRIAEEVFKDGSLLDNDDDIELGYMMMGYDGRVLASMGSRSEKTANLVFDRANSAKRQPGSTIKPIASYAPAIDLGLFNYSSIIPDRTMPDFYANSVPGPNNFGDIYYGDITLQYALEVSSNAVAARVLQALTPQKSYNFLVDKLGFTTLDESDKESLVGLSLGGLYNGVTVREMTAAFQIFGNGGIYNKPYTYYCILDRNGKVLLDNRDKIGERAIKSETATIMNRLLRQVVVGTSGTGKTASISNWDVIGKTGTTDKDKDSWFLGATPVAVSGIWAGYDTPKTISQKRYPQVVWREIMSRYLEGKQTFDYSFDKNVLERYYSSSTGKLVDPNLYSNARKGYYSKDNLPEMDFSLKVGQMMNKSQEETVGFNLETEISNPKEQKKKNNQNVDNIDAQRIS